MEGKQAVYIYSISLYARFAMRKVAVDGRARVGTAKLEKFFYILFPLDF